MQDDPKDIPQADPNEDLNTWGPVHDLRTRQFPTGAAQIPILREDNPAGSSPTAPMEGRYVGPYRVERKLSQGGMGVVMLAWDDGLRRPVALKLMDQKLLSDTDALKRFEREARAAAAIQHPNIAQVFLVGLSEEGLPFLSMEYIDGGSMMDAIRSRKALTFTQVATLMEQVAGALQAAAKVNVIHRDIKPANIMLTKEGEARVVDFGLAKIFFEDSYRTIEGMVLGTPSYMAPEQSQGRVVDLRADIYSYGATFYHLVTGRLPFNADTPVQIMMKHVSAPLVPMRSINPQVPIEFDEIIGRCMRKDVDERYQDYEALLVDVKRVRLMCHSREQGGVVGGDGRARTSQSGEVASSLIPAPPGGRRSSGNVSLPPPPGSHPSSPSMQRRQDAIGTPLESMSTPEESGWTPTRIAVVAGASLLAVVAIAGAVLTGGSSDDDKGAAGEKPAITELIQRARNRKGGDKVNDFLALTSTQDILSSLRNGLLSHQTQTLELPADLRDIATSERVIINFEKDESGYPLDGWGASIGYDPETGEMRSAGMDGKYRSSDDLVLALEGDMLVPSQYERLEVKSE
jgi:serine/threonine protein kinase